MKTASSIPPANTPIESVQRTNSIHMQEQIPCDWGLPPRAGRRSVQQIEIDVGQDLTT